MAERGEGTAGGSHSRATTSGAHTATTRNKFVLETVILGFSACSHCRYLMYEKCSNINVLYTHKFE